MIIHLISFGKMKETGVSPDPVFLLDFESIINPMYNYATKLFPV